VLGGALGGVLGGALGGALGAAADGALGAGPAGALGAAPDVLPAPGVAPLAVRPASACVPEPDAPPDEPLVPRDSPRSRVDVESQASDADVNMNRMAQTDVTFCRKLPAPRPPNTVCVAAPESTPIPPDRPLCSSTTPMRNKQIST